MKCPHCGYEHGWSNDSLNTVKGKEGDFFRLSNDVKMVRDSIHYARSGTETRYIIGCPVCNKLFLED
jgi:hypothetical protein